MPFVLEDYPVGEKIILEGQFARIARSPHIVKLPQNYTPDLAYLAGYHLGDGYLDDFINRSKRSCFEVIYADEYKSQIELVSSIYQKEFGLPLNIIQGQGSVWKGRLNCKVLHIFLHQILGLPIGRKFFFKISEWVLANKIFIKEFICGFFDAEGSIFAYKRNGAAICLTNTNFDFLLSIKQLLKQNFGITFGVIYKKANQDAFEMKISSKAAIISFAKEIGFRHLNKVQVLQKVLALLQNVRPRRSKYSLSALMVN